MTRAFGDLQRSQHAVEEAIDLADFQRTILRGIAALPPRCRLVAELWLIEEYTTAEIASELGIGVKRVEKHRQRIRQHLTDATPDSSNTNSTLPPPTRGAGGGGMC